MDLEQFLEKSKPNFGFESWPRAEGAAATARARSFVIAPPPTWAFEQRVPHGSEGYYDYFTNPERRGQRVMVRVSEYRDHETALRALLFALAQISGPTLPRLDKRGIRIGHVGFCGHGDAVSKLMFVRHNVFVDLDSIGDEPADVLSLSGLVDQQIQAAAQSNSRSKGLIMALEHKLAVNAAQYNDLHVRDNFGDSGIYPSTGTPCQSPDIIPLQSGTLTWATANSTYNGPDQGISIINGGVNNIYVRTKNLNSAAGSGTVGLYYANSSLFLAPTTWVQISSAGGASALPFVDGSGNTQIAAGSVAISSPPFLLTGVPVGAHYCLITVVQTPAHPVTIPATFSSNAAFAIWVQNNPAVGWRNISYQPNATTQMIRTFNFASVNPASAYFHFRVLGRGFATGTPINAQCTDQTCPINQNMTLPAPDVNGNQITGFDASVPGNFTGNLVVTASAVGGAFPVGATLTVTYYQYPSLDDELDIRAAGTFRIARSVGKDQYVQQAPMLIQIGECTMTIVRGS